MYYAYAEEFGCHPQDVPKVVTMQAWHRWLILKKTKAAREVQEQFNQPGSAINFTPEQRRLLSWPMMDGEY